jgi:hypothetical protein
MNSHSKNGIANVVAIVLIILLTVFILGIATAVVMPFIKDSLSGVQNCFEAQFSVEFVKAKLTCYDENSGLTGFTIKLKKEGVKKFRVALIDVNGEIRTYDVKEGSIISGIGMFNDGIPGLAPLQIPNVGQQLTYVASGLNPGVKVAKLEIAPIAKGKVCPVDDVIEINKCPSDVNLGTVSAGIIVVGV